MSKVAERAGDGDTSKVERAIVLQLLRDDRAERWSAAELANEISDFQPAAVELALARLEQEHVLRRSGADIWASRAARRLDELRLIAI